MKGIQYTIRGIPEELDTVLREEAAVYGKSLNALLIEKLLDSIETVGVVRKHDDLDSFAGCLKPDDEFETALNEQRQIDLEDWK